MGACSTTGNINQYNNIAAGDGTTSVTGGYDTKKTGVFKTGCAPVYKDRRFKNNNGDVPLWKPNAKYLNAYDGKDYCGKDGTQCSKDGLNDYFYYVPTQVGEHNKLSGSQMKMEKADKWNKIYYDRGNIQAWPTGCDNSSCNAAEVTSDNYIYMHNTLNSSGLLTAGKFWNLIPKNGHSDSYVDNASVLVNNRIKGDSIKDNDAYNKIYDDNLITNDVNVYIQTVHHDYKGGVFGVTLQSGPASGEGNTEDLVNGNNFKPSIIKQQSAELTMYTTVDNLFYFNNNVFDFWLHNILRKDYLQVIINDIREIVSKYPELIMLNKLNNFCNNITDIKLKTDGTNKLSKTFVGVPIGPPLVELSYPILSHYRFFYPSWTINNSLVKSQYDKSASNNNIINIIGLDDKTATKNGYLDRFFSESIQCCQYDTARMRTTDGKNELTNEECVMMTIPKKGCQVLEVIGDDSVSSSPSYTISQKENNTMVYRTTINGVTEENDAYVEINKNSMDDSLANLGKVGLPRIICTMKPLDDKFSTNYELVTPDGVFVPIIELDNTNKDYLRVRINTRNDDNSPDNKMYIYVTNATYAMGSYGVMTQFENSKELVGYSGYKTKCFAILYNGLETSLLPTFLNKRNS